jgi:hypothetical protein
MALDDNGGRPVAGQRESEMFYSGSLLKVAAMYAAYQLRIAVNELAPTLDATVNTTDKLFQAISNAFDKQIDESVPRIRLAPGITPAMRIPKYPTIFHAAKIGGIWRLKFNDTGGAGSFASHLRKMIVGSHNDSAGFCVRALGYSWINGVLQAAGFLRFDFPGNEGIWLAGDYEGWNTVNIRSVNDGDVKQATTCFDMARLFALLHDKKLVKNYSHFATALSGNDEMLNLLRDAVGDPGARSLLRRVPHSFTVLQSKIGIGQLKGGGSCKDVDRDRCVYAEAAILQHPPTGRKFVVVWQNLTFLRAHPLLWSDGLRRIVAVIQKTIGDYRPSP